MDLKPRRRWLKWLSISTAIVIGIPLILIVIIMRSHKVNAIRPEQKQITTGMIRPKATTSAASTRPRVINTIPTASLIARLTKPTTTTKSAKIEFPDLAKSSPNHEAAALCTKLAAEFKDLHDSWAQARFDRWSPGQPLTEAQKKWLIEHKATIADLLKLAAAGGIPMITVEQAAALDPKTRMDMPVPNFLSFQMYGRILAAETHRLVDAGDFRAASQTLMATMPLAQSISEPFIISHLISVAMEGAANRELADWLSRSAPSAEIARQLRDQLAATERGSAGMLDTMQLEYQQIRSFYIGYLDGSFNSLFMMNLNSRLHLSANNLNLLDNLYQQPLRTSGGVILGTWQSAWMRSDPAWALETFDNAWQQSLHMIETNQPANIAIDPRVYVPINNTNEMLTRTDQTLAQLRANLIALDMICGGASTQTDPFTNEPFRVIRQPDGTIIYSLGPDRQDQHGTVDYNPRNGSISAGDIIVRLPR